MPLLNYQKNLYDGGVIESAGLPFSAEEFQNDLAETLNHMRNENLKVVWLNLPVEKADLVPPAVKAGFSYHHADKTGIEMTLSLKEGAFIPPYATHYAGAGGVVLDEEGNLLVISEKYNRNRPHLKLPGGALDRNEHISDAVRREVLEETGIRTEFMYLSCLRHWHNYRYAKSDIYFVCRLKPLNRDIVIDTDEIALARWMPVNEYLSHPDTHPFNRRIVESGLKRSGFVREFIDGYGTPESHEMLFS